MWNGFFIGNEVVWIVVKIWSEDVVWVVVLFLVYLVYVIVIGVFDYGIIVDVLFVYLFVGCRYEVDLWDYCVEIRVNCCLGIVFVCCFFYGILVCYKIVLFCWEVYVLGIIGNGGKCCFWLCSFVVEGFVNFF